MRISIISFTKAGRKLSEKLSEKIGAGCTLFTKCSAESENADKTMTEICFVKESVSDWAGAQMREKAALVFIGACGIAVRAIAPHITDKLHDSPVLVLDEKGQYVIPILSGHVGGANELAQQLAQYLRAEAVITTATDLNQMFAIDTFAKKNNLWIENKEGIARVSGKLLAGEEIQIAVEPEHLAEPCLLPRGVRLLSRSPEGEADVWIGTKAEFKKESFGQNVPTEMTNCLLLRPKEYIVGMGCRKGKEQEKIEAFLLQTLKNLGIEQWQVAALASIDAKREEEGLLAWGRKAGIPFLTYSKEELMSVEGKFRTSDFVERTVGVGNVCERAAMKACGQGGRLIYEKHAEDGMTIAVAKRRWSVKFDEE